MNEYFIRPSETIPNWWEVVVYGRMRVIAVCPSKQFAERMINGILWAEAESGLNWDWKIKS